MDGVAQLELADRQQTATGTLRWGDAGELVLSAAWVEPHSTVVAPEPQLSASGGVAFGQWCLSEAYIGESTRTSAGRVDVEISASRAVEGYFGESTADAVAATSARWWIDFDEPEDWRTLSVGESLFSGAADSPSDQSQQGRLLLETSTVPGPRGPAVRLSEQGTQSVTRTGTRTTRTLHLVGTFTEPVDWEEFSETCLFPATDLISIALGQAVAIDRVRSARGDDELPREHLVQRYPLPNRLEAHLNQRPIQFGSFLHSEGLLDRWWALHARAGTELGLFAGSLSRTDRTADPGRFLLAIGFVDGFGEHVRRDKGNTEQRLANALNRLCSDLQLKPDDKRIARLARDMTTARHYLMHWARDNGDARAAYAARLSKGLYLFRDLLTGCAYRDLLEELGVTTPVHRGAVAGRAAPYSKSLLSRG